MHTAGMILTIACEEHMHGTCVYIYVSASSHFSAQIESKYETYNTHVKKILDSMKRNMALAPTNVKLITLH